MHRPLVTLFFATLALSGCQTSTPSLCGPDGYYDDVAGARVCAYTQPIVIEGGFRCPTELPFRLDLEGAAICADRMLDRVDLPDDLCRRVDRTCERSDGGLLSDGGVVCYALCGFAGTCTSARQEPAVEGLCPRGFALAGTCTMSACLPAEEFDCGDEGLRCSAGTEYCDIVVGGAPPGTETFSCNSDLNTCDGPPSCDCLAVPAGGTCDDSGIGVIVRTFAP